MHATFAHDRASFAVVGYVSFELHFSTDIAEVGVVDALQEVLKEVGAQFSEGLKVLEYERDRTAMPVDVQRAGALREAITTKGMTRGAVFEELSAGSAPLLPRRFGEVLLRGKASSTFLKVRFDEHVPAMAMGQQWLFSNSIGGQVGAKRIDGKSPHDWVHQLLTTLGAREDVLWGAAYENDEFRARNLHDDASGMWALGRDVRQSLPGVYWLNVFGQPYRTLIGRRRIETAPAVSVSETGAAAILQSYGAPEDWSTPEARARRRAIVDHLGPQFFFDREAPDRKTVAPDFGLEPLRERPAFQVLTSDERTFTPIPPATDDA
jgi:hypothetical protein